MPLDDFVEDGDVQQSYLILQFNKTPRATALDSGDYRILYADEGGVPGEPVTGTSNGIQAINLAQDYQSISRRLKLYFNQSMEKGEYFLEISSFIDATGAEYVEEDDPVYFPFTYNYTAPDPDERIPESSRPPVIVKDYAITSSVEISSQTVDPDFYVVSVDPAANEFFVEEDYKNGLITVQFSSRPSLRFVNNTYVKVQRKRLGSVGRWENLSVRMSLDEDDPLLYIYLPDIDSGLYDTDDLIYYEENFKYRVKLSGSIASGA